MTLLLLTNYFLVILGLKLNATTFCCLLECVNTIKILWMTHGRITTKNHCLRPHKVSIQRNCVSFCNQWTNIFYDWGIFLNQVLRSRSRLGAFSLHTSNRSAHCECFVCGRIQRVPCDCAESCAPCPTVWLEYPSLLATCFDWGNPCSPRAYGLFCIHNLVVDFEFIFPILILSWLTLMLLAYASL